MIEVHAKVELDRPADEVFAFLADAENNKVWQAGMVECRWVTDGPIGVGSVYEQHARMLGRAILSTFEVVAYEPGRSISIETVESTFPIAVTRSVEPLGPTRCRAWGWVRGDASGVFRIGESVMRRLVQRSVRRDYATLRQVLAA